MKKIKLVYEHKTKNGTWNKKEYIVYEGNDYEKVMEIIRSNPAKYKIIDVKYM